MNESEIQALYDEEYAARYDAKYLLSDIHRSDTDFEVETLRGLLSPGTPWLDVACGTGYFLARFPEQPRAGCDISPAMLQRARAANPRIAVHEHSFLAPRRDWDGRWGVVSCMWYAYCYVERMDDVWRVFDNLAAWTAPGGTCFVPYCDPNLLFKTTFPSPRLPTLDPGELSLDGLVWSYAEHSGQRHRQLFAPHPSLVAAHFARHFEQVDVVQYPPGKPEWELGRYAMLARNRT